MKKYIFAFIYISIKFNYMNNTIQYFTELFNNNPLLNAFSLFLAILGIIFTTYFYFKSKKIRMPIYILRTVNLVRENVQKIDTVNILYAGNKVDNLSITKIAFWNDGKETINNSDVAQNNPIRLIIDKDCIFLDAEIIYQKNPSNDFNISISNDNKYVDITFDYFDFEEGIVLQVFHTGNKSDDITLVGQIKSVKNIQRKDSFSSFIPTYIIDILTKTTLSKKIVKVASGWAIFITGLLFTVFALVIPFIEIVPKESNPEKDGLASILFIGIIGILYALMGYSMIKRKIPKGFNVFNEEF